MIFEYIRFNNFRPYYGEQTLYFRNHPRDHNHSLNPNIVLIGGLNGHGKTSLINSINICLFGHRKFDNRNIYHEYLSKSVNDRHIQEGGNKGSLELAFSAHSSTYALKLTFNKRGVEESRGVYELNSEFKEVRQLHMSEEEFNDFIDKMIPVNVSQFFIFDAEKIRDLVGDQEQADTVDSIQQIMSLNIYKQLSRDLDHIFRSHTKKISESVSDEEVRTIINDLQVITDKIDELHQKNEVIDKKIINKESISSELKRRKREILIQNSDNKEALAKRLGEYETRLREINNNLVRSKDELNQIILQPHIRNLKKIIMEEKKLEEARNRVVNQLAPYNNFIDNLLNTNIKPNLSNKQKRQLKRRGKRIWARLHKINDEIIDKDIETLHDLSNNDYEEIRGYQEKTYSDLQKLIKEKQRYEGLLTKNIERLENAPDPVDTEDLEKEISQVDQEIGGLKSDKRNHDFKIGKLNRKRNNLSNQYRNLQEQKTSLGPLEKQIQLIEKTQSAIDTFIDRVTTMKAKELKREIEAILNQLFRKGEFKKVEFDEETFSLSIFNHYDQKVELDTRSEGEKQLIALAMIWALTKVSGSNFPFVIDTPLARLDSIHRSNLVNHYFTKLSDQVIILSTDTEITENFYDELKPFIEKSYILEYNEEENNTTIEEGYFFDKEDEFIWQM